MRPAVEVNADLPDPGQFPDRDVVVWDGHCNFCRSSVERLRRMDGDRLAYLSLHDPRIAKLCPDLTHEQLLQQMWLVTTSGQKYGGADAARYLSRRLVRLYWLAPILHLPGCMPLWRWCYNQIALRRYRIAGKNCDSGTCNLK